MSARVPIAIACSLIAFALGVLVGLVIMSSFGYVPRSEFSSLLLTPQSNTASATPGPGAGAPPPAPGRGAPGNGAGGPGAPRPGGGGRAPGGGGPRGPSPKMQLADLVIKLDLLTSKPLAITLTEEEKKKVLGYLKGLSEKDDVSNQEAQQRLQSLLELLKDKRDALEAAGYQFPGGAGQAPANPFKDGDAAKHLKSLNTNFAKS